MKSTRLWSAAVALAVTFLFAAALPGVAATGGMKTIQAPAPIDERILIKAVDPKASTITIKYMRSAKAPDHTYTIDFMTVLQVNNVAAKIADVKTGMQVRSYIERDNDTLDSVSISVADPAPVDPNKKK